MFSILTLNKISPKIFDRLTDDKYSVSDSAENYDGVIVRSAAMHDMELPSTLKCIARAGAGVNNIPVDTCSKNGVVVFNSPGANANAVAELTLCGMLLAGRNVPAAMGWVSGLEDGETPVTKQVEKGKGQFAGHELLGASLGVVGLGAIGRLIANKAAELGMKVYGYDPFPIDTTSLNPHVKIVASEDDICANCDYITIHVPLNDDTKGKLNAEYIAKCKDGVVLLNMARAEIADTESMKAALDSGKVAKYVCDFPKSDLLGYKNTIYTPHLASGTAEAEDNCAIMASNELADYLENGNITNSVNYPNVSLGERHGTRVGVLAADRDSLVADVTAAFKAAGAAVNEIAFKAKKGNAYILADLTKDIDTAAIAALEGVVRVEKF